MMKLIGMMITYVVIKIIVISFINRYILTRKIMSYPLLNVEKKNYQMEIISQKSKFFHFFFFF